ncbi:MAG: hypothetical protein FD180_2032 [Planctomycetota bacterium]|nr:MAG: hypothetical protein FD180_2032 [Planctomycetota bacterium]
MANPPGAVGTLAWDESPCGAMDMGGNPGELARKEGGYSMRSWCMCIRRVCVHETWRSEDYSVHGPGGVWTFRCVRKVVIPAEAAK